MAARWGSILSLPVFAVLLAVLTFGVILLGRDAGYGVDTLFFLAIPIAAAGAYLAWYRTLPIAAPSSASRPDEPSAVDDEPFEDPVEEAVLLDEQKEETEPSEGSEGESEVPARPSAPPR